MEMATKILIVILFSIYIEKHLKGGWFTLSKAFSSIKTMSYMWDKWPTPEYTQVPGHWAIAYQADQEATGKRPWDQRQKECGSNNLGS